MLRRLSSDCCPCRSYPLRHTRSRWRCKARRSLHLGSYWKGRKPLILNKACILGCLLPATDDPGVTLKSSRSSWRWMTNRSSSAGHARVQSPRNPWHAQHRPHRRLLHLRPARVLPESAPVDWSKPELEDVKIEWRDDVSELERRQLEAQMLPKTPYRDRVEEAKRPEEVMETVHDHIWEAVNAHLGTKRQSFPELVEQLGIMRFGHRPRVADTFCGSGQISLRGSPARLRRVCLRPQSRSVHADLGRLATSSVAIRGNREELGASSSRNLSSRCRPKSTGSASNVTAMAGGPRFSFTAWKPLPANRMDGSTSAHAS